MIPYCKRTGIGLIPLVYTVYSRLLLDMLTTA